MKKFNRSFSAALAVALGALSTLAGAATFNLFSPANGILKGNPSTYVTTAAASSDVRALWSGTCDVTTFLRGDGSCAAPTGTVSSVGLTMPTGFSVANSPVTSSGTLAVTTTLNGVLKGDGSGFSASDVDLLAEVTGILPVANGGIGVGTLTGIAKGNGTSAFTAAASTDVRALWSGTCDGSTFLRGDGTCAAASGSGTPANPTALVGLTPVNGVLDTFLRSDGAPALDQGIAPTWTAKHIFSSSLSALNAPIVISSATPGFIIDETDGPVDERYWRTFASGGSLFFGTSNDGNTITNNWLVVDRTAGATASLTFGNATDNPSYNFLGTGTATFAGNIFLNHTGVEPTVRLQRNSSGAGVGVGRVSFEGLNASAAAVDYGRIQTEILTNTAGSHTGKIDIEPASGAGFVSAASFSPSSATYGVPILAPFGSASNPTYAFDGDADTGVYRDAANSLSIATNGSSTLTIRPTIIDVNTGVLRLPDASAANPSLTFWNDPNSGLYRLGSDNVAAAAGGVQAFNWNTAELNIQTVINIPDGTAGSPSLRFNNDSDSGMYRALTNSISFATGGSNRMTITDSTVTVLSQNVAVVTEAVALATVVGCTTSPTVTVRLTRVHAPDSTGGTVTVKLDNVACTSNSTSLSLSGAIPAGYRPAHAVLIPQYVLNNGSTVLGSVSYDTTGPAGQLDFGTTAATNTFTASGSKGTVDGVTFTYTIENP